MTDRILSGLILLVAITQFLPILGVLGVDKLNTAYGVSITDPNLEILMRHRAVMFGLLGTFIAYSAFRPDLQILGFIAAAISIGSFFWLAWSIDNYNPAIGKLIIGDIVATVGLVAAVILYFFKNLA